MSDFIIVKGAREHNLQNIDVTIPRNKLVVITGLSGSGKSSLAFDTIYAEGQRRYVESLSSYARQFLGLMEKPDVDQIDGLSPAISIDQKSTSRNPRSTVATVTEIYDYLRLLFARVGIPHCPVCEKSVTRQTATAIVNQIIDSEHESSDTHVDGVQGEGEQRSKSYKEYDARVAEPSTTQSDTSTGRVSGSATKQAGAMRGTRIMVLAPVIIDKKGIFEHVPEQYQRAGFARVRVDGIVYALDEFPVLDRYVKHTIEIVIDRLVNDKASHGRLSQSVEQALELAEGKLTILNADTNQTTSYSLQYACIDHPDIAIPELEPRTFSFNSPHGACPVCTGLGSRLEVDPELVIPNGRLTIAEGAIRPFNRINSDAWYMKKLNAVGEKNGFSLHVPTAQLRKADLDKIMYGTGDEKYKVALGSGRYFDTTYEGVVPNLERRHKETDSDFMRRDIERFMQEKPCHACKGLRLKPEVLAVTVDDYSIMDICNLSIDDAASLFNNIKLGEKERFVAQQILKELKARLVFLQDVGLNYLTLLRSAVTLSGGEAQRIRLATQIGSGLMGVLYILDEPSIGLHQRDNARLIRTLKHLRDLGNTVIVVEHDEETIRTADFLLDIGPGAGIHGGKVIASGSPEDVAKTKSSITGQYLRKEKWIDVPKKRRQGNGKTVVIKGARQNNLQNIDVTVPLGKMVVVSGVSGSGKSSLINDILAKELSARLHRANMVPGLHDEIQGIDNLDKVIIIDQSPIGRTPRSNPATYTGLFTPIRDLYAATPEAKIRGYKAGRFSFNVRGGRCENCAGDGIIKIEMHFLPDVYVTCEECKGKRYNREALEIHFKGKSISDVLQMTCEQALEFFENISVIARKLETMVDVGLGYIALGQPATTLSGGEAQRVKLATELSRRPTGRTLYILDEPTTGLHMADVNKLLSVLHALVDAGNSMIVIEHNLDVIKNADYVIDMGPEGGDGGGKIIANGTPEQVAKVKQSSTGSYLKKVL